MSTKTTFHQDMQSDFCKLSPVQPEVRTGVYLSMKSCGPNATGSSTVRCKCVPAATSCTHASRNKVEKEESCRKSDFHNNVSKKSLKTTENICSTKERRSSEQLAPEPASQERPQQLHELVEYPVLLAFLLFSFSFASHHKRLPAGAKGSSGLSHSVSEEGLAVRSSGALPPAWLASPRLAR